MQHKKNLKKLKDSKKYAKDLKNNEAKKFGWYNNLEKRLHSLRNQSGKYISSIIWLLKDIKYI